MSAYIKRRTTAKGDPRYLVYYRVTGRHTEKFAGSFKTKREAQARRDIVAYELAGLRDPAILLAQQAEPVKPKAGLGVVYPRWAASRRDVGKSAKGLYRNSEAWWLPILGADTDPAKVTVDQVLAGVDEMLVDLVPATVRLYLSHLAMVLDFADVTPNPARSHKIKLPNGSQAEKEIPANEEWTAISAAIGDRSRLVVRLMECCAFRVSEACGVTAGDIDVQGGMVLVRRENTKTRAGKRWVPVPEELLGQLLEAESVGVSAGQAYYDLDRACKKAGVRLFGTHALRHRRISLWIRQGIDPVQIARWVGHGKASISVDLYGHTIVDALSDEWLGFWQAVYGGRDAALVRHGEEVDL